MLLGLCYTGHLKMNPKPWEFQPGIDDGNSFAAFSAYLQLPARRRVEVLAGSFQVEVWQLRKWERDGLWADRALSWDRELHRQRIEITQKMNVESAQELREQELDLIRVQKKLAQRELDKLLARSIEHASSQLKPRDVVTMYTEAFKAERLVRGQATEIVSEELDLSKLTDEELAQYDELSRKAKKDGTG